jgi:predicted HD superfamily hydrolase involved in NAD metabolism
MKINFMERGEMLPLSEIKRRLRKSLNKSRYKHSIETQKLAEWLAEFHDVESLRVGIAGLLHDCAKGLNLEEMKEYIMRYEIKLDEIEGGEPALWHCAIGEAIARAEFGVVDPEILRSIRMHSTGGEGMTKIEKIVCIADYIEPTREFSFEDKERIKKLALSNLDLALKAVLISKLLYIQRRNRIIHPRSLKALKESGG